jgi:small membrane protein
MTLFQWVAIPLLAFVVLLDFRAYLSTRRFIFVVREFVWISAILLIRFPQVSSELAQIFGIGRGTDLVVYAFMLSATVFMFHLYGRNYTLRRDVVELARRDALRSATFGQPGNNERY